MDSGAGDTGETTAVPEDNSSLPCPDKNVLPVVESCSPSTESPLFDFSASLPAREPTQKEDYILSIDIGTSSIRGHIYTKYGTLKGSASKQQTILHPEQGRYEIDPLELVEKVKSVAHECIAASGLQPQQVTCMGITTMRATFVTWDRETGQPFHNLITWQDLRASDYVSVWNKSYTLRTLNFGAKVLHMLMRKKRHLAASVLRFMTKQVTMRLLWALDNIPEIRKKAGEGNAMFGCIETWVLWKLTGGKCHVTDYSCASSTGLFDPFQMEWSGIVCGLLNIPMSIFPLIRDTSGEFGVTDPDVFGFQVPITAVVADQQGAMFGQCCFDVGDVKCTMGTGTFLDLNTGSKPHASVGGLYPLVGWKIGSELVFIAEGQCADTGNILDWAKSIDLLSDTSQSSQIAQSVPDSGGVVFVPAFSGLQAPFNDDKAVTSMVGLRPSTTKAQIVRAMLESLAFRFKALYEMALTETRIPLSHVRVDGGVANNDFLVQLMADLVDQTIDRSRHGEMTCLGAAFLAGLAKGVWSSKEELYALRHSDRQFKPQRNWQHLKVLYHMWDNAVHRSRNWYP
ncbi:putative glycerol kinase 5 isoform X2 [Physella acuta]|nr:putative glycerol kinase 5 isoform X2 [Physella acuta]XP_059164188.1 putative glycerol kinase 5 isoform X2 [Physella acuta]